VEVEELSDILSNPWSCELPLLWHNYHGFPHQVDITGRPPTGSGTGDISSVLRDPVVRTVQSNRDPLLGKAALGCTFPRGKLRWTFTLGLFRFVERDKGDGCGESCIMWPSFLGRASGHRIRFVKAIEH
jgi:hypothetical protein